MVKGFSKSANKLLSTLSQQVGKLNGSSYLLPEHMLVALIMSKEGNGYEILEKLQINMISLQLELERFLMKKNDGEIIGDLPYSRRLQTIVDGAMVESRTFNSSYIGTEHLLISSSREEGSIFHNFLIQNNITLTDLRNANSQILKEQQERINAQNSLNSDSKNQESQSFEGAQNLGQTRKVSNAKESFLAEYTVDLTQRAKDGKIDPIIGREKEIQRMIQILVRRTKNNPVLIGEAGVGKTAIVELLALKIATNQVPEFLLGKRILSLDLALMVAGTHFRGDFEERLKRVMKEVLEKKNIILFVDELHTLIGAGGPEGGLDGANMMKPALSRGELQVIGSTTTKEYAKYFEKDAALVRRFQSIKVEEPSVEETVKILNGIAPYYEKFHGVKYSLDTMELIAKYSQRYISGKCLPDKAIDVLDEAGSVKKIACSEKPEQIQNENILRGIELEEQAATYCSLLTGLNWQEVGFVEVSSFIGCSPDRIVLENDKITNILEIKCPNDKNFLELLVTQNIPKNYICQVNFQMMCCEVKKATFFSYNQNIYPYYFMREIDRDEEMFAKIQKGLDDGTKLIKEIKCKYEKLKGENKW